MNLHFRR